MLFVLWIGLWTSLSSCWYKLDKPQTEVEIPSRLEVILDRLVTFPVSHGESGNVLTSSSSGRLCSPLAQLLLEVKHWKFGGCATTAVCRFLHLYLKPETGMYTALSHHCCLSVCQSMFSTELLLWMFHRYAVLNTEAYCVSGWGRPRCVAVTRMSLGRK